MDKVLNIIRMVIDMRDNLKMAHKMVRVYNTISMEINKKEVGRMAKSMAVV